MAIRDIFKVNRKTFIDFGAWIGLESIIAQSKMIWGILRGAAAVPPPGASESFEDAVKRQGLTEKDINDGERTYRLFAIMFFVLGMIALAYGIFILVHHQSYSGLVLAAVSSALLFSQAFKYDFWSLQMRRRHLGLTYADWKRYYLGN